MLRNRLLFLRLTSKMKSIRLKTMSRNRTGLSLRDEISHDPDTSAHDRKLNAAKQEGRRRAAPARLHFPPRQLQQDGYHHRVRAKFLL